MEWRQEPVSIPRVPATSKHPRRSRAAAPAAPIRAPDEIVGLGFSPTELGELTATGFEVLERNTMTSFNAEVIKLRIPRRLTLEAARQRARAAALRR